MARKTGQKRFQWTSQHNREGLLLRTIGKQDNDIARRFGCSLRTLRRNLGTKRAFVPLTANEFITLFEHFDIERNIVELLATSSGSIEQARLRTSLRNMCKTNLSQRTEPEENNEGKMKSLKQLKGLSEDELQTYVATLVSGLEDKTAAIADKAGKIPAGDDSVSSDGPPGTKATETELEKLAVAGRTRCRQNTGRG